MSLFLFSCVLNEEEKKISSRIVFFFIFVFYKHKIKGQSGKNWLCTWNNSKEKKYISVEFFSVWKWVRMYFPV